ncbi:hypothetical protein [Streptacidiphilus rugosus]|uniref:hypothetical protein n=1 Tax=Streptacidiphilus rugosus TaxID=405783 RepID=UPI0005608AF0|nr:hypothetical protein [Streptacidiphilus rugosus]
MALPQEITARPQQRVWANQQPQPTQEFPRQRHQQSSEERAILRTELQPVPTEPPLQDCDLMTQDKDLHVLLPVTHRQQPHRGEGMGDSQIGMAQQHR